MNVLFFTYDFPYPTTSGGKNRAYNLLKYGKEDIQFVLFSFYRNKVTEGQIREIEKIGINKEDIFLFERDIKNIGSVIANPTTVLTNLPTVLKLANPLTAITRKLYYKDAIFTKLLEVIKSKKIETVVFESFYTSYYIHDTLRSMGIKQIFGTENIEHLLYQEYIKNNVPIAAKPFYAFEMEKIKRDELNAMKKSDICLAVTKIEADYITETVGKRCEVIANGVDPFTFIYKKREKKAHKTLLFVGNFTYFANVDAMNHFYHEVFEKLTRSDIKLMIIGKNVSALSYLTDPRIEKIEYVDNILDAYEKADILISPIRIGGGTNFKVLEAMAVGLPVVALADKVKGLEVENNIHILTAETIADFKNRLDELLDNDLLSRKLSVNARKFVESRYDWRIIGSQFNKVVHSHI